MSKINECLTGLGFDSADAEEIRRQAREVGGDEIAGVKAYIKSLNDDVESLRNTLSDKGYDFSIKKPAKEIGIVPEQAPAPQAEPTYTDIMGEDVTNIANAIPPEHASFARALYENFSDRWGSPKEFFKWSGENNKRLFDFAKKFSGFRDEQELELNAKTFQESFPELFQKERRGKVSDAQTEAEAVKLAKGRDVEQNANRIINTPTGYAPNASEIQYYKLTWGAMQDDIRALKDASLNVNGKLTTAELDVLENKINEMNAKSMAVLSKFVGGSSELGRGLRSVGVSPTQDARDTVFGFAAKGLRMLKGTAKTDAERAALIEDFGKALATLDGDPEMLGSFIMHLNAETATLGDKFYEVYYNSLLSNPSTQAINIFGSMTSGALDIAERGMAAGLTKGERLPFAYRALGYWQGIPDAWNIAKTVYKTELPSDPQTRMETANKHALGSWKLEIKDGSLSARDAAIGEPGVVVGGKQVRVPGRLLMAADEFMKSLHQRAHINEAAARAAGNLKGVDREVAIQEFLKNVPPQVMRDALEESRRLTYTDPMGAGLRGFQQLVDEVPGGRIIIPFIRTPAKIIQQAAEMITPLGRTGEQLRAGGFEARKASARLVLGYTMLGTGVMLAQAGLVSGPTPTEAGERRMFEANNMLPWAVKTGDTWVQINRWDPVAIPFTVGVGFQKTLESMAASGTGAEREDQFLATMSAFLSDALLDKSFFQGIENVVGAVMEPERRGEAFGKNVVRSFVPAVVAGYARAVDPRVTAPNTFWEVVQDRIGFDERKKVPTKLDGFGREVPVEVFGATAKDTGAAGFVARMVSPFKARSNADDPIANELWDLGIKLNAERKKYKDIELDSAQRYVINKAEGKYLYDGLRFLTSQPNWKDIPKEGKRMLIEQQKDIAAKAGQMMLLGVYPELLRQSAQENSKIKKLTAPTRSQVNKFLKFGGAKKLDESK